MYIVGITGASGVILGLRVIQELLSRDRPVSAIVSPTAWDILRHEVPESRECGSIKDVLEKISPGVDTSGLTQYSNDNLAAPVSSGSNLFTAVIVAPCSMKSLSAIANAYADSLINRVADVALKESRRCILVPRETPLNLIHIENMAKAKRAGADIVIPVPGFYALPRTIDDVVNFTVGKIFNILGIEHELFTSWE